MQARCRVRVRIRVRIRVRVRVRVRVTSSSAAAAAAGLPCTSRDRQSAAQQRTICKQRPVGGRWVRGTGSSLAAAG